MELFTSIFRGNVVAIKKMKETSSSEKKGGNKEDNKMREFEEEVSMLDKFRSEYIVHFYGAVFIPTKVCMVTEFAQYGSLNDLIDKRVNDPLNTKMRVKGKRPSLDSVTDNMKSVIENTWKQDSSQRINIDEVVSQLESVYNIL